MKDEPWRGRPHLRIQHLEHKLSNKKAEIADLRRRLEEVKDKTMRLQNTTDDAYWKIAPHMWESLEAYVYDGRPTGDFLRNVLEDSLSGAAAHADDSNCQCLYEWVKYLHNNVPAACHGSPAKYREWVRRGGLAGFQQSGGVDSRKKVEKGPISG